MFRVRVKVTGEKFWMDSIDIYKIGTKQKIDVYEKYPGCQPLGGGSFACNRSSEVRSNLRTFVGEYLELVPVDEVDQDQKELLKQIEDEIKRQKKEEEKWMKEK